VQAALGKRSPSPSVKCHCHRGRHQRITAEFVEGSPFESLVPMAFLLRTFDTEHLSNCKLYCGLRSGVVRIDQHGGLRSGISLFKPLHLAVLESMIAIGGSCRRRIILPLTHES
jgi:hypothetical protein